MLNSWQHTKSTFNELLNVNKTSAKISKIAIKLIDVLEKDVVAALGKSNKNYLMPCDIWHLEKQVKDVLSIGNQTGEGWFLTAEMIEYIENDIPNICMVFSHLHVFQTMLLVKE